MEKLIEHDGTTPPKALYEQRRKGKTNADVFDHDIVPLGGHPEALYNWARHIAWLSSFLDAGARIGLDEFKPYEWSGLAAWRAAQSRVRERYRQCPGCGTLLVRRRKQCPWCHWDEKQK